MEIKTELNSDSESDHEYILGDSNPASHCENDVPQRDASGRIKQKGACYMCYRESKRKRATRQACIKCKKPTCAQHYFTQTNCEDCHVWPSIAVSNYEDEEFKADDVAERDATGRIKQKGGCFVCYRGSKRKRSTRQACVKCNKPVCAQHCFTQTKCKNCHIAGKC